MSGGNRDDEAKNLAAVLATVGAASIVMGLTEGLAGDSVNGAMHTAAGLALVFAPKDILNDDNGNRHHRRLPMPFAENYGVPTRGKHFIAGLRQSFPGLHR